MADWLKMRHALVRSPKVHRLARLLGVDKYYALGVAYAWLCWVDEQTEDGHTHLLPDEVDAEMLLTGFADALRAIGWVELDEATGEVVAVDWEKHCGPTAKKRAEDALRQAKKRARDRADNVTEASQKNCDKRVTRKEKNNIDTEGVLSATVDMSASACPSTHTSEFGDWLKAAGMAVPMLQRLNLDKPLPRAVEAGARKAAALVPMTPETVELLRRYYAAEEVRSYRPNCLEWFFRDLPDVLQHAANWCRQDDREQRKAAATARRKAKEASVEVERGTSTPEEEKAFFEGVWSDLGEQYRERSNDEEGR